MSDLVLRVQAQLTGRDHVLLGWLADHGVLTSFQIAHALFPTLDYAQERLRKLTLLGVVDRFRPQKPDGGSHPYHYVLAQLGVEVVSGQRGEDLPRKDRARKRRWHLTNRANLPHLLGTNQFFTDLAGHARTHPDSQLVRWWPAARCQGTGAFADPDNNDIAILAYTARIRPDGHGIWAEHDQRVPFFLEYDTGTERPLHRLVDKIDGYLALAAVTGQIWPVLFWLHSTTREHRLHHLLTEADIAYPVATATHDHTTGRGQNPAEAVWWLHPHPAGAGRLRLADLSPHPTDTASTRPAARSPICQPRRRGSPTAT